MIEGALTLKRWQDMAVKFGTGPNVCMQHDDSAPHATWIQHLRLKASETSGQAITIPEKMIGVA